MYPLLFLNLVICIFYLFVLINLYAKLLVLLHPQRNYSLFHWLSFIIFLFTFSWFPLWSLILYLLLTLSLNLYLDHLYLMWLLIWLSLSIHISFCILFVTSILCSCCYSFFPSYRLELMYLWFNFNSNIGLLTIIHVKIVLVVLVFNLPQSAVKWYYTTSCVL